MEDKKKDLIPVAAIALFLVIIIILCVVRLQEKKADVNGGAEAVQGMETVTAVQETASESKETEEGYKTEDGTQAKPEESAEAAQDAAETESESIANQLPSGKPKENKTAGASMRTISGNDPFAGADSANKSNEQMLLEMAAYWEQDNMEAVEDLAMLAWYMKMSASIADEDTFYYYGERNDEGQPQGKGIACYADNAYYYGEWEGGRRSGQGEWIHYYVYYDDDTASDRAYRMHMYMGEWASDMPNGEGQEHYELDMAHAAKKDRYIQNVIGTFQDGRYSGEMYLTTLNWDGNQEEWNGVADSGVWSPYGAGTNAKEVPICRDVDDDNNYLWIFVRDNKEQGIGELMP